MTKLRFWTILIGVSAVGMTVNFAYWGRPRLFSEIFWLQLLGATVSQVAMAMVPVVMVWVVRRKTSRSALLVIALGAVVLMTVARLFASR